MESMISGILKSGDDVFERYAYPMVLYKEIESACFRGFDVTNNDVVV
jgi:hypothetical protein